MDDVIQTLWRGWPRHLPFMLQTIQDQKVRGQGHKDTNVSAAEMQ